MDKFYRPHGFPTEFKFTKNKRVATCAQVDEPNADILAGPTNSSDSAAFGLSKEQYQHLVTLLQQAQVPPNCIQSSSSAEQFGFANFAGVCHLPKVQSVVHYLSAQLGRSPWIVDPGVTNHTTPHKHFLHNIQPLASPYLIILPNGYKVKVISSGSLHLRQDIILHNVLLVPSF